MATAALHDNPHIAWQHNTLHCNKQQHCMATAVLHDNTHIAWKQTAALHDNGDTVWQWCPLLGKMLLLGTGSGCVLLGQQAAPLSLLLQMIYFTEINLPAM